jgi:hypothetical protein
MQLVVLAAPPDDLRPVAHILITHPEASDGMGLDWTTLLDDVIDPVPPEERLLTIYADAELVPDATLEDVFLAGGAVLSQEPARGQDARAVGETVGDAATMVRVGPFDGAVVESSTFAGGYRTRAVYWSDGRLDLSLQVASTSGEAVRAVQALYCADPS